MKNPVKLSKKLIQGLKALSMAEHKFMPIQVLRTKSEIAEQLVETGFAERGECSDRIKGLLDYEVGYRLTKKGWNVFQERREG